VGRSGRPKRKLVERGKKGIDNPRVHGEKNPLGGKFAAEIELSKKQAGRGEAGK